MSRLCLYFRREPETNRWVTGDRWVRPLVRRLIRGPARPSGLDKVFINLCKGLDKLGVDYKTNLPFAQIRPDDEVAVLGVGRHCLDGYRQPNPIIAGIGLMTHPSQWPTLCQDYPVVRYLQHSAWANAMYEPYYGSRCGLWPVGIDTDAWNIHPGPKTVDFLVYNKIRWDTQDRTSDLLQPIERALLGRGLSSERIRYGAYSPAQYRKALGRARAMIFLCEHESQGIAYQECLSSGVPILAWDQGWCLDPERFSWNDSEIPATSVPCWDARCGLTFDDFDTFENRLDQFMTRLQAGQFAPRAYVLEHLTLEGCATNFLRICRAGSQVGSVSPAGGDGAGLSQV